MNITMKETGAPADMETRLEKEQAVYRFLDDLSVSYERADHEVAMTMEDCEEVDKLLKIHACKNLFLCNRQKTKSYLLVIDGRKHLAVKELCKQLESPRLSFAGEDMLLEYLNLTPGSVTVFGLLFDPENQVQLVIDRDVMKEEHFGAHPCINTTSLAIPMDQFQEKVLPALQHEPIYVNL